MHIITTTKTVCSKCGSEQWEGFTRAYGISGIRCLSCGHSKMNDPITAAGQLSTLQLTEPTEQKF